MTTATLLATLREATAAHHARTESLVPALDPALGLEGYAAILRRFRAAYGPLEAMLARAEGWPAGFDVAARRKVPLLDRDLAWLAARGVAAGEPVDVADLVPALATVPTLAEAIGILYVLEGASLGGRVILRQVGPRLGVAAGAGACFYAGDGEATGRRWRAFGAMADTWGAAHRDAWETTIAAARATFDAIAVPFIASPVAV